MLPVTHGVPQSSILDSLLFLIYINDLPTVIKHSRVALYTDDAVLYFMLRKVNSISVSVCGTEVEGVESFKYLGVVLSSNFAWSEHV